VERGAAWVRVGPALPSHGRGHRFETCHAHHPSLQVILLEFTPYPLRPPGGDQGRGGGGGRGGRRRPVIADLPHGFDTEVGGRVALLAVDERQLVAFARAWMADPALLLLDEATSNLDVVTEARVQRALRRLRQGRTTIVIAHRLTTVAEADQRWLAGAV
jgi:hypothetical protein